MSSERSPVQIQVTGLKQIPIYYSAGDRSHYKVGIKNNIGDKDYGQTTFVKFQYLPQHKYVEEQEKAVNINDMGNVIISSNRRENLDGNEMNSGNRKIEDHLNGAVPYNKINGVILKPLLNEKHVSNSNHEDSIPSSQQKITKAPDIQNAVHKIQPMNKHGLSVEESWGTNVKKRPEEEEGQQSIKDKGDPSPSDYLNYQNSFNNYKDYNNIPDNYEDAEQLSQKIDMSESQPTKAYPWNGVQFHEIYSESSRANPYKKNLFEDPKLADNENLIDSIGSVTVRAKYSPNLIFRIDNSDGVRPKQMSDYLNNIRNTYKNSDVGKVGTKDDSHPEFIRKYSYMDSLEKERVSNAENSLAHKNTLQKNNIDPKYPEKKATTRTQYFQDSTRKFAGRDPEILSIHEADLRYQGGYGHTLADLIHGELVTAIVRSIMNKVISDANLRQHIASGFGAGTKGKSGRATKLAPTAEEMYCASRCAVDRRAANKLPDNDIPQSKCLALPEELKEFLKWMLEGSTEEVHSENENLLLQDQLIFYSSHHKGHPTKEPEVGNKSYDPNLKKKMQLVLQLLSEYEQLNDNEKDTVSKVHHYLQEELERLQNVSTEAPSTTSRVEELEFTAPSLPSELLQTFTYEGPVHSRHSSGTSDEDLVKHQLEMLGLNDNAKLGQRLSDRFDYSTRSSFLLSENQESLPPLPPLRPLLDNDDSVFK